MSKKKKDIKDLAMLEWLCSQKGMLFDWERIRKPLKALDIIKKMVECGYLKWTYGELRTCGTNNGIAYPLDKEEDNLLKEVLL